MVILKGTGQAPSELLDFSATHVQVALDCDIDHIKVFRGEVADHLLVDDEPSILGHLKATEDAITFKPIVPFDWDVSYTLVCGEKLVQFQIDRPVQHQAIAVTDIYPSSAVVPANILKWYIRFSRPVNPIKIYDHIHFLDHHNQPIDRSILHLEAPLLSEDATLLTVWVEPGRQKQLLGPNRHLGSVFEPGRAYTLLIDNDLKDAQGVPLGASVRHSFQTEQSDRAKPSIVTWETSEVLTRTREPLIIRSTDQLDYGSLLDAFHVYHKGKVVDGTLDYNSQDSEIYFTPLDPWAEGRYQVQFSTHLEDVAGNNLLHLFDRPIDEDQSDVEVPVLTIEVQAH